MFGHTLEGRWEWTCFVFVGDPLFANCKISSTLDFGSIEECNKDFNDTLSLLNMDIIRCQDCGSYFSSNHDGCPKCNGDKIVPLEDFIEKNDE